MPEAKEVAADSPAAPTISRRLLAIAALSLLGVGVSGYLTYEHYASGSYFCAGLGDCDFVNSSVYAVVAGVPVALLGLLAYAGIFVAALASLRDDRFTYNALLGIFGLALIGVLFSAYLTYVELYILHAI